MDAVQRIAMNHYMSADVWDQQIGIKNTCKTAKPNTPIEVSNARVIVIKEGMYRSASFNGTFLLGQENKLPLPSENWHKVEIYCCWFGLRLKTRGVHFKVNMGSREVIENYSGLVYTNLSK